MNFIRKAFIFLISLISLSSYTAHAIIWPVQDTGRKGIMSLYGDYRSEDVGCNFHGGIDITQNVENNATDNCEVPVLCALDSTFVCYMVSNPGKNIQLEDIEGIILKSGGIYYWYLHIKGIKPQEIQRGPTWQFFSEGQHLGFIAEESDPAYGGSSAHIHFVSIGGTMYEGSGLDYEEVELSIPGPNMKILAFAGFKPATMAYWPLENPLNILPDADIQDTEPPIFINSAVSGTPIDIVPNLVWIDTGTSSATHENGYVDKAECPWVVRGKVDIIARVNDYMNIKGYAPPPLDTDMLPGIYEIKYEIIDGATPLMEKKLVWDDLPNSNFNGLLPGGEIAKNRFKKGMHMHPFIINSSQFGQIFSEGYDHIRYNHNYYVVSNTTGSEIDMNSALDTSTIPEGTYTIRVTARDHAGNSSYVDFNVEIKHADIYVDGSSNRQPENGSADNPYRNIGTALNAASYGDTVFVAPGTYTNEAFPLNIPNGVSVVGSGAASTTVYGDGTHGIFRFEDTYSDTQLSEFKIQNAGTGFDNAAIYIRNSQGIVSNCHITGNAGLAIHAQDCQYHPVHSFKIVNNVLNGNYDGIYNHSCASALRIENTTIDGAYIAVNNFNWCSPLITNSILATNTYAVMASNNSDPTISFSCVNSSYVDYDWDYSSSITRIGNFGGIPYYESGPYGSYYLNPISNCINYGLDSNVTFPDIYTRTTQAVSTPFPSGYYDEMPVDIGYHYCPVCYTPTPPPTPVIYSPTPCTAYPQPGAGWVKFSRDFYETESMTATIEVTDSDLNTDPYAYETVDVTISSTTKASIPFTLREASTNSNLFTSTSNNQDLEFTLGSSVDYESIQVVDMDTVTVTYVDETYMEDRTDSATWYQIGIPTRTPTSTPTGTWSTNTPTSTPTPTETPTGTWSTNTPTETPGGPTEIPTATSTVTSTPGPWTDTDSWGYTGTTVTSFNWIDATSGTNLNIAEDDGYASVNLPFSFDFYENSYDTVNVSANGYLTFGSFAQESDNDYMPKNTEPNDVIAPFFDNLDPSDTGNVFSLDSGTSVTIEWDLVRHNRSWTDSYTFEVTLYNDGQIKFQYYVMSGIYANGYSATVGIENDSGTVGLRYRSTYEYGLISNSMAILFTPPSNTPIPTSTPETLQQILDETVESGGDGWSTTGLWHVVDTGSGNPCAKAHWGSKSFWYGLDASCNYDTGTANSGELISPPITLAENIAFTFWSWEEVAPNSSFGFGDNRIVYVSEDNGQTWTLVFIHEPNTADWEQHSVDMDMWENKTVKIKFVFDTINEFGNNYAGWYVDDIDIESSVPPPIPTMGPFGFMTLVTFISFILFLCRRKW